MYLLTNPFARYVIAALVALVALWGYGEYKHHAGYSEAQQAQHIADLEGFKIEANKLTGLSTTIEAQLVTLREQTPKIVERYTNVTQKTPLPVDCRLDADRLRALNEAVTAANTRKPSHAVPLP
jgi:hypothetical protein